MAICRISEPPARKMEAAESEPSEGRRLAVSPCACVSCDTLVQLGCSPSVGGCACRIGTEAMNKAGTNSRNCSDACLCYRSEAVGAECSRKDRPVFFFEPRRIYGFFLHTGHAQGALVRRHLQALCDAGIGSILGKVPKPTPTTHSRRWMAIRIHPTSTLSP